MTVELTQEICGGFSESVGAAMKTRGSARAATVGYPAASGGVPRREAADAGKIGCRGSIANSLPLVPQNAIAVARIPISDFDLAGESHRGSWQFVEEIV